MDEVGWRVDVELAELCREYGLTGAAERRYVAAVEHARWVGLDRPSRAAIMQRVAQVRHDRGDRAGAMPFLDEALALVADGSDPIHVEVRAGLHATRGRVARDLGDLRTAEREAGHASELYGRIGDVGEGARVLVDLAVVLKDTDRITPARTVARLALALARSVGADDVAGHAMVVLGLVYELLGRWRPALRSQSIALRLLVGCGQYGAAAVAAHNAGAVALNHGRHAAARQFYETARELNRRGGWPVGEANDLSGLAGVAKAVGDHDSARALHAEALQTLVAAGDLHGAVLSLVDLAELADDEACALAHLTRADTWATQADELRLVELVQVALGDLHREQGRLTDAETAYERAADAAEAPRAWLFDEADALAFFGESRLAARERLARLALDHHDPSVAFERVESARASEMVRRLSRLRAPTADRVPADLVGEESAALAELRVAVAAFSGAGAADPGTARSYASAEARWQAAVDAIAEHDEQYAQLRRGDRSTAARISATLRDQAPDALLVVLHGTETAVHVLGLTADDEAPWHDTVRCDTAAVIGAVERIAEGCRAGAVDIVADGVADPLLTAMLEPVVRRSRPGQQICLVPHGALHRLPFAAVPVGGRPLGERNPLVTAPSASVLRYCLVGRRATTDGALVVTGPAVGRPLLYASAQSRAIARHFPVEPQHNRADVLARLAPGEAAPGLLHFTAHGRFVAARPMSSGIRLADGDLTAQDLLGVSLPGTLVVLCACRTGVTRTGGGGDEQLGLVRALLYAGAAAVLVGLWRVSALAAAILFDSFYRELAEGSTAAVALQRAQRNLRTCTAAAAADYVRGLRGQEGGDDPLLVQEEARLRAEPPDRHTFANPFYWAPFALVGDWR